MPESYPIRDHIDAMNRADLEAWLSHFAPDAVVRDPQHPDPIVGRDALRQNFQELHAAFSDVRVVEHTIVEDGATFAFQGAIRATHTGAIPGPDGELPPTGRTVEVPMAFFVEADDQGRVAREWRYYDLSGWMRQLGVSP